MRAGINCVQLCGYPFNAAFVTPSVCRIPGERRRTESSVNPTSVSGLFSRERMELDGNERVLLSWEPFDGFICFVRNNARIGDLSSFIGKSTLSFSQSREKKSRRGEIRSASLMIVTGFKLAREESDAKVS